jgi:hypothetical protein
LRALVLAVCGVCFSASCIALGFAKRTALFLKVSAARAVFAVITYSVITLILISDLI